MGIYHLFVIYQSTYLSNHLSININLLSISIFYLLSIIFYYLSLLIIYSLSYLLLSIISYLSIIYLSLSIIWLFSLYLYDAKMSHHVPPQGRSQCPACGGIRSAGILVSRAPPQLCSGGSVRVSVLVQDGPQRPESHSAACWVCRVGCVRATASSALQLSFFSPPLHSC